MRKTQLILALAAIGFAGSAFATTGYFSHGYGMKSKGMGGVGIAYGQDAMASATNPANMVLVGNRWDVGLEYFRPQRESKLSFGAPIDGTYDGNDSENYFIPEFGYNHMISKDMSLGVSVFGNGGMATDYDPDSPFAAMGVGSGAAGVDLSQVMATPTWSMKLNENNAVGVSLKLAYQRFKAFGIQAFDNPVSSSAPGHVSNEGYDYSWGYGISLGWTGKVSPTLSLGLVYNSKVYMDEFDTYKGLFAEQGDFDIPENYGAGLAWQATPQLVVAFDYQRINFGDINSLSNKGNAAAQLGSNNGPGFGWEDMNVYKLGVAYELNKDLTLRAGYVYNDEPYEGTETFFNILAPGVVKQHVTLGATWKLAGGGELTFTYMHAFENTIDGEGSNAGIDNTMYQDSFGVAYGAKF